jgi:hypothetical protein
MLLTTYSAIPILQGTIGTTFFAVPPLVEWLRRSLHVCCRVVSFMCVAMFYLACMIIGIVFLPFYPWFNGRMSPFMRLAMLYSSRVRPCFACRVWSLYMRSMFKTYVLPFLSLLIILFFTRTCWTDVIWPVLQLVALHLAFQLPLIGTISLTLLGCLLGHK